LDQGYLTETEMRAIYDQAEKVSQLDSGMIKYFNKTKTPRPYDAMTQ